MSRPFEHCCRCGAETGKAGAGDGSLYTDDGSGPFCAECYVPLEEIDRLRERAEKAEAACACYRQFGDTAEKIGLDAADRIEALTAERDDARAECVQLREDIATLNGELLEGERLALEAALENMVRQFAVWSDLAGGYVTGGLSALEEAFDALGWEDPHPAPEARCQAPRCTRQATCGTPVEGGKYLRLCGEDYDYATEDLLDLPEFGADAGKEEKA